MAANDRVTGLIDRLGGGGTVLCAEGYLLELSRRGYITHGSWVPDFILDQPHVLKNLHYEFVHAGSDVVEAFQYYTHREKMREIGREEDLEAINRAALKIAREVAYDTNKLFAGGISNTNIYKKGETEDVIRAMFDEQVRWSKEEGVDYMIAETISYYEEAVIALDVINSYNLPAVVTMNVITRASDGSLKTLDGVEIGQACLKLLDQGATLVGVNCYRGLDATFEVVQDIVKVCPPDKVAALPVAYRTTPEEPTFFHLTDPGCPANNPPYPRGLQPFGVSPVEISQFTRDCMDVGMKYMGICCGNSGELTRAMAEAMGRSPPASKYIDTSKLGLRQKMKDESKVV
jgi:betaine-homocysteine S-methyltransferase